MSNERDSKLDNVEVSSAYTEIWAKLYFNTKILFKYYNKKFTTAYSYG